MEALHLKKSRFFTLYYALASYTVFTKEKGCHSSKLVSKPVKSMPKWGCFFSSSDLLKFVPSHKICGRLGSSSDGLTNDRLVLRADPRSYKLECCSQFEVYWNTHTFCLTGSFKTQSGAKTRHYLIFSLLIRQT